MSILEQPVVLFWLAAVVILLIIEGLTVNLTTIWFAIGAAAALLVTLIGGGYVAQAAAFIVVSVAALLLTKPLVDKWRNRPTVATNGDRNVGRIGTVIQAITPDMPGRVRLDGVDWNARTADGASLAVGARCRVTAIESTTLTVVAEEKPAVSQ